MIYQCCVAGMVRTWLFNGFVADHQLTSSWMVGFFRCPVPVMLWDVGLLHHYVNDMLHVLARNSLDGSPLDPVSFM